MNKSRIILAAALSMGVAPDLSSSPVVVELFTSQGCSSCPDADAVISRWGRAEFEKGAVLPLTYNVDYWNYLGWKDVFSAPSYSERQRRYASRLGVGVYTPQMVVAGRTAFVGSDGRKARAESSRLSRWAPAARLSVEKIGSGGVKLSVAAQSAGPARVGRHLFLAIFENDLVTEVPRGENRGSALRNDFVVRRLIDLGPYEGGEFKKIMDAPWDPAWKKEHVGAAVFLQDMETLAIESASWAYPLN